MSQHVLQSTLMFTRTIRALELKVTVFITGILMYTHTPSIMLIIFYFLF